MSSPISSLSVKTQNIPLAQAVGLPLDAAKRSLAMTGSLNFAVNAKDISRATLGKIITTAVQSGAINLNASPAVFNARTGSNAGTEILAIAKGLNVKTDGKTVKQLIADIGDKTVASKGTLTKLPDSVAKILGGVSIQALVSSGEGKLNALGVAIGNTFNGGKWSIEAKGVDKLGMQFEAVGTLQAKQGDTTASVEGRLNTRGGTTVKGVVKTTGQTATGEINASASSIPGTNPSKVELSGTAKLGTVDVKGAINYTDTGKTAGFGYSVSASKDPIEVKVERSGQETKASVNFTQQF